MDRRSALALMAAFGAAGTASAGTSAEFPFRVTRNQPWAAVSINEKDPQAFLIDTGSNAFGITPAAAAGLGLARITSGVVQGAIGRVDAPLYVADKLVIGGGVREHDVLLVGLKSGAYDLISGSIPIAKFGVMGLDFDRQLMLVAKSLDGAPEGYDAFGTITGGDTFGSVNRLGTAAQDEGNVNRLDQRPVIKVELDGQPVKLMVDTGSSMSLFLRPDYVRSQGLWDHYPKAAESAVRTIAGTALVRVVRAEQLTIGRYQFKSPIVHLGDPAASGLDGSMDVQGLIGMELLRRFNFINHPGRKRLYLKPSQAMQDVYRYDRAGIEIDAVDSALRVTWVREGGPAARAGLVRGDKVTGWRGKDGYYGLVWALTGPPGTKVEIQVERGGAQVLIPVALEESI